MMIGVYSNNVPPGRPGFFRPHLLIEMRGIPFYTPEGTRQLVRSVCGESKAWIPQETKELVSSLLSAGI